MENEWITKLEKLEAERTELLEVAKMAVESQSWSGDDPNENRWTIFYRAAKAAVKKNRRGGEEV